MEGTYGLYIHSFNLSKYPQMLSAIIFCLLLHLIYLNPSFVLSEEISGRPGIQLVENDSWFVGDSCDALVEGKIVWEGNVEGKLKIKLAEDITSYILIIQTDLPLTNFTVTLLID